MKPRSLHTAHLGALAVGLAALVACSSHGHSSSSGSGKDVQSTQSALNASTPQLNTFISSPLEIDQKTAGSLDPNDANLFVGNDPADQSLSYQNPAMAGTYVDWNDLGVATDAGNPIGNHRLLDTDGTHVDGTSFPQSNSCVGESHVLSKMDLTYVAAANNSQYAYFGVQRSDNNGDAGYYWLFTKKTPHMDAGAGGCKTTQQLLTYDLSNGDVLLAGHFVPNGSALLRVFKWGGNDQNGVQAVNAIDFTSSGWSEDSSPIPAVAVNETITAPGSFGSLGVEALSGANLGKEVFAEAAVKLSVFTGGSSSCGATYYGSVITRSSGSGGTSPDLKDLAGPALFNFGSVSVVPTLTPGCDSATYGVTATGIDGSSFTPTDCSWTFTDANGTQVGTSSTCSGSLTLSPGTYKGTVSVKDSISGCSGTQTTAATNVYGALSVGLASVAPAPVCSSNSDAVTYKATVTGGDGKYSYTWNATGDGGAADGGSGLSCSGSSCTISPGNATYCYASSFTVTVSDSSSKCPDVTSNEATYSKVTTVTATP